MVAFLTAWEYTNESMNDNILDFETHVKVRELCSLKLVEFRRTKGWFPNGEERDHLYDEACADLGVTDPGHEAHKEARRLGKERRAQQAGSSES